MLNKQGLAKSRQLLPVFGIICFFVILFLKPGPMNESRDTLIKSRLLQIAQSYDGNNDGALSTAEVHYFQFCENSKSSCMTARVILTVVKT